MRGETMPFLLTSRANIVARDNLAKAVASERPLALVGAGLSVAAGLPTWSALLDEMEAQLPELHPEYAQALRSEPDLLWRAEEYRRLVGESAYQTLLRARFSAPNALHPSDPSVALVKLPFRHFLTTNYDDVLLKAHELAHLEAPRVLNWSREDDVRAFIFSLRDGAASRFILHVHGHHSDTKTMVLTDNDYTERYVRSSDTARKLFAIFTTERVVFAGFSLNDPDLMALLREVNATIRADEPRHFAIMGLQKRVNEILERNRLRKRYGVEPVFYDNADGSHLGLVETLEFLSQQRQPSKSTSAAPSPAKALPAKVRTFTPSSDVDPEDPQKGKWGGKAKANGREVRASVREIEADWFETILTVRSTSPRRPLQGTVIFHLHPTMVPSTRSTAVRNGIARLKFESYGAFTVGVEADRGATRLELDLATLGGAPLMFTLN
jgi:hypothetical protein